MSNVTWMDISHMFSAKIHVRTTVETTPSHMGQSHPTYLLLPIYVIRTSYAHLTWNWRENGFQKPRPLFVIFNLKNITFRSCCCYLINKTCEKRIPTWFRMILFIPTHIAVERIYPSLVHFFHSAMIILTTATCVWISQSHFKTMLEPYNISLLTPI